MNALFTTDLLAIMLKIALLLLLASVFGLCAILARRVIQRLQADLHARHKAIFVHWIINFVHSDLRNEEKSKRNYLRKLKLFRRGAYPRLIILEVIHNFYMLLSGDSRQSLLRLYDELGLIRQTFRKIHSRKLRRVMQAIREIRDLNLQIDSHQYLYLLKHPVTEIREEAFSLLASHIKDPVTLLFSATPKLTRWQKIQFYHKIRSVDPSAIPDLSYGLNHATISDKLFLLDIIRRKNLQIYFIKLLNMLRTEPWVIQRAIVYTLAKFGRKEAIPALRKLAKGLKSPPSAHWVNRAIGHIRTRQGRPKIDKLTVFRNAS